MSEKSGHLGASSTGGRSHAVDDAQIVRAPTRLSAPQASLSSSSAPSMPSGALLLPMTKVGAGDKERAYVVRQNILLKTILAVLAALVLLGTTLCCTIYKVDLQRRTSLKDAREHR